MSYNSGKNWKKKNQSQFKVFMNPNKDKSVKATKVLNELAAFCEKTVYIKDDEKHIKAGFELNPVLFKWEYHVNYKNNRLVMTEDEDGLYMWMYFGNADKMKADFEGGIEFSNKNNYAMQVINFLHAADLKEKGVEFSFSAA